MLGVQPSGKTQEFSEFPYAASKLWTYVDITRTTWGFQQPKDFLLATNKIPRWGLLTVVCIGSGFWWVRWLLPPLILKDFHFVLGCGDARFSLEQVVKVLVTLNKFGHVLIEGGKSGSYLYFI